MSTQERDSVPEYQPRIKGVAMLEVVKGLRLHKEAASGVLPEALHKYLERRVEIGEWYPEADHFALLRAAAELFGPPGLEAWRWMGRQRATIDLREVFSDHLHPGDLRATMRAFERLWSLYRDSGRVEVTIAESLPYHLCLIDFAFLSADTVRLFTGYIETAFELAGLRDLRVIEPVEWTPECAQWTIELDESAANGL